VTVHVEVRPALPPIRSAREPSLLRPDPNTYGFNQVCLQLGILFKADGRMNSVHWRTGYLMALIESPRWQFPEPLPRYNRKAGTLVDGAASVGLLSSWHKGAVDTWFERFIPPGSRAAAAAEQDLGAAALDQNSGNLATLLAGRKVRA